MKESTGQLYKQRILQVQMYIQQNLDRDLSLKELAAKSYFSEYHFHRIFRAVVGEPLKEHIRRFRLERAASDLKHTNNSIINIAFDAGYQTHEAFTRAFKSVFGTKFHGRHHEIYISDPRRVPPERLKTSCDTP
jgi:AraC family transcriptional regulator